MPINSTTMDVPFSISVMAASATMTSDSCVSETMRGNWVFYWRVLATFLPRYGSLNLQILCNQIGRGGSAKLILYHAVNAISVRSARSHLRVARSDVRCPRDLRGLRDLICGLRGLICAVRGICAICAVFAVSSAVCAI